MVVIPGTSLEGDRIIGSSTVDVGSRLCPSGAVLLEDVVQPAVTCRVVAVVGRCRSAGYPLQTTSVRCVGEGFRGVRGRHRLEATLVVISVVGRPCLRRCPRYHVPVLVVCIGRCRLPEGCFNEELVVFSIGIESGHDGIEDTNYCVHLRDADFAKVDVVQLCPRLQALNVRERPSLAGRRIGRALIGVFIVRERQIVRATGATQD